METKLIAIDKPDEVNFVFGQAHFIKTVEDLHEAVVTAVPQVKFGLAFCEASGPALIRTSGNEKRLIKLAAKNARAIGCGHSFLLFLQEAFPINVLTKIKSIDEVVQIYCATANPVTVVVAVTKKGRGVLGVIDGVSPKGVETKTDQQERQAFLRKIGYKL